MTGQVAEEASQEEAVVEDREEDKEETKFLLPLFFHFVSTENL